MDVGDGSTVEDETTHVLSETAADVEELGAGFDAGEDGGVVGGAADGEVEEAETACVALLGGLGRGKRRWPTYARIREDIPSTIADFVDMRHDLVGGDVAVFFEQLPC